MSKIEIDGFLSDESEEGKNIYLHNYKDVFDFANEINRFSMKLMRNLKIDWNDNHNLIMKTLHIRLNEYFQGTILMLERGMMPLAKVLTRAMLETVFILVALQKNRNYSKTTLINTREVESVI